MIRPRQALSLAGLLLSGGFLALLLLRTGGGREFLKPIHLYLGDQEKPHSKHMPATSHVPINKREKQKKHILFFL